MQAKRKILIVFLAFWSVSLMIGSPTGSEAADEVIKVRGANSMASLVNSWANLFNETNPSSRVVVSGGGTAAAFDALYEKGCQLVMSTRSINEKELQAAALSGTKPTNAEICRECVAIVTNPVNTVKELDLEQLRRILVGEVTNWEEVGGPKEPILVITVDQTGGLALFLRRVAMADGYFTGDARIREFYSDTTRDVSRSRPLAISYALLSDAYKAEQAKQAKILAIKKTPDSAAILPSLQTMRNDTYPLIVPMYLYWDEPFSKGPVRQFVEFCKGKCRSR